MFLSEVLIHTCIIMHYIEQENFCCYYLQTFSTAETLKSYVNDYFKINGEQMTKMLEKGEKGEHVRFKNY